MTSAFNLVNSVSNYFGNGDIIKNTRECFTYSKQTNLSDLAKPEFYRHLQWVEFLEFICRASFSYARKEAAAGEAVSKDPEDQVLAFLKKLWSWRWDTPPAFLLYVAECKDSGGQVKTEPWLKEIDKGVISKLYALKKGQALDFAELVELDSDADSD